MTNRKKLATLRREIGGELRRLKAQRREQQRNYERWGKSNPKLWRTGLSYGLLNREMTKTLRKLLKAIGD